MAEIVPVVSESLEATVRNLLPSQRGFGEDLQASNVITPIIDLTPTAEGSVLPTSLQQAIAYGSQTSFFINNTSSAIVNTTGFHRIFGVSNIASSTTGTISNFFQSTDGVTPKTIWQHATLASTAVVNHQMQFDFIIFIAAGESLNGVSQSATCFMTGSVRQVADITGNLVSPSGFTFE